MSSSESEDENLKENLKQLIEAADTSLFNNAMFRDQCVQPDFTYKDILIPTERPPSNRYLIEEESVFQSDLTVTESMKTFIGKKLSKLIANSIAFVEVEPIRPKPHGVESSGVKLLRGFKENLNVAGEDVPVTKSRKLVKNNSNVSQDEMIKLAAYNVDVLSKSTVGWTNRSKSKRYEYRQAGKSKTLILSITDEFSTARRKNNWDDSKIKAFRNNR